jgi:transglutaminase-like putative cysteine protease
MSASASPDAGEAAAPERASRVLSVRHQTVYEYEAPVQRSSHLLRLRPVHDRSQELFAHSLAISVDGSDWEYEDVFGNQVIQFTPREPFQELRIESLSRVRLDSAGDTAHLHLPRPLTFPVVWMPWEREMMQPFAIPPELPETQLSVLSDFVLDIVKRKDDDVVETLMELNRTIRDEFSYVPGVTDVETTPFEVFVSRRGVCQDFANLFICLAQLLHIPARYRVGYIFTGGEYERQMQSDASHAWVEVYLPRVGWRGFDPTNGTLTNLDHVRVACGRYFRDATPTSGTIYAGGGNERLSVRVEVEEA